MWTRGFGWFWQPPQGMTAMKFPNYLVQKFWASSTSEKGCAVILGWKETSVFWDFLEAVRDVAFCELKIYILHISHNTLCKPVFMSLVLWVQSSKGSNSKLPECKESSRGLPFLSKKWRPRSSNHPMMCHTTSSGITGKHFLERKFYQKKHPRSIAFLQALAGEVLPPGPSWPQNPPS